MTRKRRAFRPEYKAEVVCLVRDGGKGIAAVVRDLGLTESAVRNWVSRSEADAGRGGGKVLSTAERWRPTPSTVSSQSHVPMWLGSGILRTCGPWRAGCICASFSIYTRGVSWVGR